MLQTIRTSFNRRSFLKSTALAGGGMLIGFHWAAAGIPMSDQAFEVPEEWFKFNGFLKISPTGQITIQSPNPEIGQNVKTSMPMIVADELDADWSKIIVEQAPLNTAIFKRQLAGGSQSIRQGWQSLRMAGASAREMLKSATAQLWNVPIHELSTKEGHVLHIPSGKSIGYGEIASKAAVLPIPAEVTLKSEKDFHIIGTSRQNVDGISIVTGKPLFGIDYKKEGMRMAMIVHPPAFGLKLKSADLTQAKKMPGIVDAFTFKTYNEGIAKSAFDNTSFNELIAIVGKTTWEVMQGKKAVQAEWKPMPEYVEKRALFDRTIDVIIPSGLESTASHLQKMDEAAKTAFKVVRKDGDPETAFGQATHVLERTYEAPFLPHNTLEPMNFFADVTETHATLVGPIQTPEIMEKSVSERLGIPVENIDIQMTRMGGGFGRRLYGHFLVEAAVISQMVKAPVKLLYTREDDMTSGIYRPAYRVTYRAAFDADKKLTAFHVRAGGVPESPLSANRFPAGAIDNYLAEEWSVPSNISVGAWRAPRSNFIAGAEQSFLDEVAEYMNQDPIAFRLTLLEKAQASPVGKDNDYDPVRYAGVLKLVQEKANWSPTNQNSGRGVAAYFCHNSYVAQVVDVEMNDDTPIVKKVTAAVDCGIVINQTAAVNMTEGGIVDGIGHALYGNLTFADGVPEHSNFNTYRLTRHREAPKEIEVYFVENGIAPTGLGEPPLPPVIGALANALYKATGKRFYKQPFLGKA